MKIFGQILIGIGLTLLIGGIASFYFDNVELDYWFGKINSEYGRFLWILVNLSIALIGFSLIRFTNRKSKKK
ncbi:MAG: hypothetical protein IH852_10735 [Bacteroidetes bacterium]|nr:hypothetical protein [Bacteroidota bacterium]